LRQAPAGVVCHVEKKAFGYKILEANNRRSEKGKEA